jgi:hypothetical protein
VTRRGGFFARSGNRHPFSWSSEIFPGMKARQQPSFALARLISAPQHNYTRGHRATSVGHDLIKYYSAYLSEYESAHPGDVTPFTGSVAPKAPQPLAAGDRLQVWWPLENKWFSGRLVRVEEEGAKAVIQYDDGDEETLTLEKEKWRRERPAPRERKRRPEAPPKEGTVLPDGAKRKRAAAAQWREADGEEAKPSAAQPHAGPVASALLAPPGLGEAGLARFRQRLERKRVMGGAPLTRRTASFFAAAEGDADLPAATDVPTWLRLRGFSALAPLFEAHEVDWETLPLLTGDDLADLGLGDAQQRRELLIHVTREYNSRVSASALAEVAALSDSAGERMCGVGLGGAGGEAVDLGLDDGFDFGSALGFDAQEEAQLEHMVTARRSRCSGGAEAAEGGAQGADAPDSPPLPPPLDAPAAMAEAA